MYKTLIFIFWVDDVRPTYKKRAILKYSQRWFCGKIKIF